MFKLPRNSSELEIRKLLFNEPGYGGMTVSEPMETQDYKRIVWAVFVG
jgi:hypothetical protein